MASGIATICFDDFTLDIDKAELRRGGETISVEPQVYDLIVYLARNSEHVVSRDDIIEHIWDGRIVSDTAISTRINAARHALDDDGKTQKYIKTVRQRGFRFAVDPQISESGGESDKLPVAERTPMEIRYCRSVDGVNLAYQSIGSGSPLVKAPSFLSHLEFEHESPVWRHWVRELSRDHQYVRFDQRGNGMSDWQVDDISFDAFVEDLKTVTDHLELKRFPVLGVSQGAAIATEFTCRYPEKVSGLILLGGYVAGWRRFGDPSFQTKRDAMLELMKVGWGENNPAFRQVYTNLFVPSGTPEQQDWFNDMQKASATPENAYRILKAYAEIDVRSQLAKINVPTLVVHCRGDAIVPYEAGRQYATGIANARMVTLEGENHVLLERDPGWPIFLSELRHFLKEIES